MSERCTRDDVASDGTSLTYVSGYDCYEKRNFKARQRGRLTAQQPAVERALNDEP
jgi:hypothetical protein